MTLKRIVISITLFTLISTNTACQRRTIADGRIKVTISSSLVDEYFKDIIDEFEVKYPHIQIVTREYKVPHNITYEKYVKAVNTEVLSGSAADIINIQGLPYREYIKKGVLKNLDSFVEETTEINNENIFMNIIDGCRYGNSHYMLPLSFSFKIFAVDIKALSGVSPAVRPYESNLHWDRFIDICRQLYKKNDNKPFVSQLTAELLSQTMVRYAYTDFINDEKKTVHFSDRSFIDILNFTQDLNDSYIDFSKTERLLISQSSLGDIKLVPYYIVNANHFLTIKCIFQNEVGFLSFPKVDSTAGNLFTPTALYGINAASKHHEEAWLFLKFLLSESVQERRAMPVNRKVFQKRLDSMYGTENTFCIEINGVTKNVSGFSAAEREAILEQINSLNKLDEYNYSIDNVVQQELERFYQKQVTAEDAAENMQDRIKLYLNE